MARLDPHSYTDSTQPTVDFIDWTARVDFDSRTLVAQATLSLLTPRGGALDLDTRELTIHSVSDDRGESLEYTLFPPEPILGSRLHIHLVPDTRAIRIRYRTSPSASALQWLEPEQTSGGKEPFLYSQCQAIHARSIIPLQDTPRLRIRYRAALNVPRQLRGIMAAQALAREETDATATERFEARESIPPYLLALAVGQLTSRDVGPRSRVWAEPEMVESAAWEFADVETMIRSAEDLFGTYLWERFDILAMPPSFPYGGMENPRLTFITPTVFAGDRSLVSVVMHELAHSWTGNLVSNASAEHFWLNEGFTVYAERRILEKLEGADSCELHAALGRRALEDAISRFSQRPELTRLRTQLAGVDPDEAFSQIPYEKGYLFLRALEEAVGRAAFDPFLRQYLSQFQFRSITTEDFSAFLRKSLPGAYERVDGETWLYQAGIPPNAPNPRSAKIDAIAALGYRLPSDELAQRWSPSEWQLFLERSPHPASLDFCQTLDSRFRLTQSGNYEVLVAWLILAAESGFAAALPRIEEVLSRVGRMKYLRPLYTTLAKNPQTRELAKNCFERFQARYHPIARMVVAGLLRSESPASPSVS
jgi:leukotriene A-4 hydrolase/aminopeptidase